MSVATLGTTDVPAAPQSSMKKILVNLLKFALAAGIIGYLVYDAAHKPEFTQLLHGPKNWNLIGVAFVLFFVGVCLTFVRWQLLVRALDFPFTTQTAFRLGFLGYLFNFIAPGGVGGDLFKAVFIAREYKGRRAQAVATVLIDRIVGLYALFVVASIVILLDGLWFSESRAVRIASKATLIGAVLGAVGIVMLLIPGFTQGRFSKFLCSFPRVGRIFQQLLDAVRMYRTRLGMVGLALLMSMFIHLLTVVGYFVLGLAIPGESPTLSEHFVIIPLAMVAGAIPITPNGLGTMEAAIEVLFPRMSANHVAGSRGLLVSLVFRLITIVIALVGVVIYALTRREVSAVMHEAEEVAEAEEARTA
jgi:uncharacterized protein (TIRG00374 family)